jgi:hypothetical protein
VRRALVAIVALLVLAAGGGCGRIQALRQQTNLYSSRALTLPSHRVSVGGGGGVALADARPFGLVEVTGSPWVLGPHASLGASFSSQHQYFYGEVAGFAIVVVGAGAGYEVEGGEAALHGYIGLPVNVLTGFLAKEWLVPSLAGGAVWYGEIFYRPIVGLGSEDVVHEIGFFVKRAWGGDLAPE